MTLEEFIVGASRILVFTGAGISTPSGIPDYRGPEGVWNTRRPVYFQDFTTSDEARRRYWQQKLEDRAQWGSAEPNEIHYAIVNLEGAGKVHMVVTQNVDGLHRLAGTPPARLIEIHGSVREVECLSCGERTDPDRHFTVFVTSGEVPLCHCGGLLKPATVSFGQPLRRGDLDAAFRAAEECDLVLALGSTLSVTPAADIPLAAARRGTPYVIVNLGLTEHDELGVATLRLEEDVADVFPQAVAVAIG